MSRVKRGVTSRARHKRLLARTEGYRMTYNRLVKRAREADLHAGAYAFAGRKLRKRDMRRLWIVRISGALRSRGLRYRDFIHALREKNIQLDRKSLATLLFKDPKVFEHFVNLVK